MFNRIRKQYFDVSPIDCAAELDQRLSFNSLFAEFLILLLGAAAAFLLVVTERCNAARARRNRSERKRRGGQRKKSFQKKKLVFLFPVTGNTTKEQSLQKPLAKRKKLGYKKNLLDDLSGKRFTKFIYPICNFFFLPTTNTTSTTF